MSFEHPAKSEIFRIVSRCLLLRSYTTSLTTSDAVPCGRGVVWGKYHRDVGERCISRATQGSAGRTDGPGGGWSPCPRLSAPLPRPQQRPKAFLFSSPSGKLNFSPTRALIVPATRKARHFSIVLGAMAQSSFVIYTHILFRS